MSALRYAVLDANGVKVNGILVDNPYPQDYWPGYGRYITAEHGEADPVPPANLDIRTGDRPFSYLTVRPAGRFSIGDTMNLETGEITYAPPPVPPEPEPQPE
jgi:hypothetical protein